MAPINENSFRNWKKYRDWCNSNGFDPFKASDKKIVAFLSTRVSSQLALLCSRGEYLAIKVIFHFDPTPFLSMIRKGLRKGSDPRDLELFDFTPEQV